ncbi:MAG: AlpA family phage regulatory protein [Alcaligenaceae bacterium]|nr:AlpA family phage regulatory protein [Alcaligenaceae bacterium]
MQNQTVLLNINDIKDLTGYKSKQSIYNIMEEDDFPKPINVGSRSKRWIATEVENWIQGKIEASRQTEVVK